MHYRIGLHILSSNNFILGHILLLSLLDDTLVTVTGHWVSVLRILGNRRVSFE
jgi:hypothetical protein